ncbi:MAG: hypothetical protein K8R35_05330 [Bacteroidales bacterium]|nr:hypothetical protein [Bacteroidales bacterium]
MDFIERTYRTLLETLSDRGFLFGELHELLRNYSKKNIILRHDVDMFPKRALRIARIENEFGITGSYYFRSVKKSWDESVIAKIAELGHEVGYHYEDLSFAKAKLKAKGIGRRAKGEELERIIVEEGIESFGRNLERLRKLVPVKTICMHGSPLSRWDSRLLWKYYDYGEFGIEGEPYFDVSMQDVLYLTDTGRRWNGNKFSIRDKPGGSSFATTFAKASAVKKASEDGGWNGGKLSIRDKGLGTRKKGLGNREEGLGDPYRDWKVKPKEGSLMNMTQKAIEFQKRYNFKSTNDIIRAAERGELPDRIMMTFHPQRWTDKPGPWMKELVWQNVKNVGKYFMIKAVGERKGCGQ